MNWFKQLFSRGRLYNDLSDEIQEHLEEQIEFGNVTLIENDTRDIWRWPALASFFADIRYALRTLHDLNISSIKTSTMITTANSLCRERDAQSLGRRLPHAMSGYELSRVRTEFD